MNVLINIDAKSSQPIYRQIVDELKNAIVDGYLKPGEKLPSTRDLGKALGISRFTVMRSYEDLVSAGYIKIATGSGAYVSLDLVIAPEQNTLKEKGSIQSCQRMDGVKLSSYSQQASKGAQFEPRAGYHHIAINNGTPKFDLLPLSRWKEAIYSATRELESEAAATHCDPFGRLELREAVADYLSRSRRVRGGADRVVLFSSWQNAFDFILRLIIDAGDECAVESPGLPDIYRSFLASGATVHPVALDHHGMHARGLSAIEGQLKAICISPSRNEPTGVTMSAGRRQEVLLQAEQHQAYVIENDLNHEFRYGQKAIASLQGTDNQDRVVYIGSFAQVLGPLTRTAYVVLPEHMVETARWLKMLIEPDYAPVDQIALARFMQAGHFERHIKRTSEIYAERRAALVHALTAKMADSVRIITSGSGTNLAISFNQNINHQQILQTAAKNNISLVPIGSYYPIESGKNEFIVSFGHLSPEEIHHAVTTMADQLSSRFVAPMQIPVLSLGG